MFKFLIFFANFLFFVTGYAQSNEFDWKTSFIEELELKSYKNKLQKEFLPFFKDLYLANNPANKDSSDRTTSIPKIIHQIWLGSPLPKEYVKFQITWKEHHPDWEYKLWTEIELATFNLKNQKAFDQAANYGEKANIWRYEILERFGGLYVDTDYECLKPFDEFMENYEFFSGMSSLERKALVSNALIACIPHHPIIKECVEKTNKLNWKNQKWGAPQFYKNGIFFFERIIFETAQTLEQEKVNKVVIFPPSVFYPSFNKNNKEESTKHSFAIHYFDRLWMK